MMATLLTWLAGRNQRERRLLGLATTATAILLAGSAIVALRDDLDALRARVHAHERELIQVRRLAATIVTTPGGPDADGGSLSARLQEAADTAGVADRVAAVSPTASTGDAPARVALRVSRVSLAETVQLLHALDDGGAGLGVARLGLRKHPDDPQHFDVTLEVAGGRTP